MAFPQMTKCKLPYKPAIYFQAYIQRNEKMYVHTKACIQIS